jgi:hypothetical protein
MIGWLEKQGCTDALWDFTIACCRRVWHDLPGESFRRVVEHFEQLGRHDIEEPLAEASRSLDRLEGRLRKTASVAEQTRLNRKIGYGRIVLAFDYQDAAEAALSTSDDQIAWADDPDGERRHQADLLRQLAPDPSRQNDPKDSA